MYGHWSISQPFMNITLFDYQVLPCVQLFVLVLHFFGKKGTPPFIETAELTWTFHTVRMFKFKIFFLPSVIVPSYGIIR